MTDTGLIKPGEPGKEEEPDGQEDAESGQPVDEAGGPVVEAGKDGARRRGKALRDFLQAAGTGAVAGSARYAAERVLKELFGE